MQHEEAERRRFSRLPFEALCDLTQQGRHWRTQVIDISLKGMLLEQPADWNGNPEQSFVAVIHLVGNHTSIDMTVELKHSHDNQLGFECLSFGLDSATHLRRLIELNLGDEALLQRDLRALVGTHQVV